jgi:tetratricopeptide (TPR) repeat protein
MNDLPNEAVKAALNQDWPKAIELNLSILESNPEDIATLNRLGFAYMQIGNLNEAKNTYNQVLSLDKYNPIAIKSLEKTLQIKSTPKAHTGTTTRFFTSFLEEPGRTKSINLIRPASSSVLINLSAGVPVKLNAKKRRVGVENSAGQYIGCLPDDIGFRLCHLIKIGYKYEAFIKSANNKQVCVFIKETSRSNKYNNLPSFPINHNQNNSSLPKPHPLDEIPIDTTPTGEEDAFEE